MSLFRRLFGPQGEVFCEEGLRALDRRDFAAAAQAFRDCLGISRREATLRLARFHLAECHGHLAEEAFLRGDFQTANDAIEAALYLTTPTAERHMVAAQIAYRLEDRVSVDYHLERALHGSPGNEQALALQALAWYEEGRWEDAVENASILSGQDGRVARFQKKCHAQGDRQAAADHLRAVANGYPGSLILPTITR